MALDTNNTNQCYLHGRLVALIVNTIGEDKLPASFPELCAPGRKNAAFLYWAKEALKSGDSTQGSAFRCAPPLDTRCQVTVSRYGLMQTTTHIAKLIYLATVTPSRSATPTGSGSSWAMQSPKLAKAKVFQFAHSQSYPASQQPT